LSTATTQPRASGAAGDGDRSVVVAPKNIRFNQALYDAVKSEASARGATIEQFVHETFCDMVGRPDLREKSPGALLRNAG
jgi:hypothetical protein